MVWLSLNVIRAALGWQVRRKSDIPLRTMTCMQTVTLVFEPAEEGGFSAYVAEVPGVNSQGETIEDAKRMVIELTEYRREKAHRKAIAGTVYDRIVLA